MMTGADDDDDLPPEHLPFGELLNWLAARLGRKPTLEDVAALRFAQRRRAQKREHRANHAARYRWPRSQTGGDVPSAANVIRGILTGPEMLPFWTAAAWLVGTLPGFVARPRVYDEWVTRPETVTRLAEAAAALPAGPVFAPTLRVEVEGVLSYALWKLDPIAESPAPAETVGLARPLVAAVNALAPEVVRRVSGKLELTSGDGERRRLLGELRRSGEEALKSWPGVGRLAPGAPLGLLIEEPDVEPEAAPTGEDGPPTDLPPRDDGRR